MKAPFEKVNNPSALNSFSKKQYLNLESFRRSGEGVKTPVWFCQDGGSLYVVTRASSGKVKRIHNNGHVNVAPCKMDGRLIGAWNPALASQIHDPETILRVDCLMENKYGLLKRLFKLNPSSPDSDSIIFEIKLVKAEVL